MKKLLPLFGSQFFALNLIILNVLFMPILIHAGTFYNCVDNKGNSSLSDYPVDGMNCTTIQTIEETKSANEENKKSNKEESSSSGDKVTRVTITANKVLVPVTFIYENNETNVNLVLDTGASATLIYENAASPLYINLSDGKKIKGRVAGGGTIDGNVITMNSVKVGPYTFFKKNIVIVPYEGPPPNYDGLLGMDLLGQMKYKLDLGKQVIFWD